MAAIDEESIQIIEASTKEKSNKSKFLQKVKSNISIGETPMSYHKSSEH